MDASSSRDEAGASSPKRKILLIAHRGGEGQWPSNTLFAFERALSLGSDVLETDIHATADGALVLRHDPTVDSTTNGRGLIRDYSLADLKELDAGYTWTDDGGRTFPYRGQGITIPTLEELFLAFPQAQVNIDIKDREPQTVRTFSKALSEFSRLSQIIVGSFHDPQLVLFRRLCPEVRTAAGVAETRRFLLLNRLFLDRFFKTPAYAFQIPERYGRLRILTPRFIRGAHRPGLQVHIWTVNDSADMLRLVEWGVDGIMTDYPDRLKTVLDRPQV